MCVRRGSGNIKAGTIYTRVFSYSRMCSTNGKCKSVAGNALKYFVFKICGSHSSADAVQFSLEWSSSGILLRLLDSDHHGTTPLLKF